jgi:hypothetical protein
MRRSRNLAGTILALTLALTASADPPEGRWNLLIVRVDFNDAPGVLYSDAQFTDEWVPLIEQYYVDISNGLFDLRTTVIATPIRLADRKFYHACTAPPDECREHWTDAVVGAVALELVEEIDEGLVPTGGTAEDVFDGVLILTGAPTSWPLPDYGACGANVGPHWHGNVCINRTAGERGCDDAFNPGGAYQSMIGSEDGDWNRTMSPDCDPVVEPKEIGAITHEIGHGVAFSFGGTGTHPAGYDNNFAVMDNCGICVPGANTRVTGTIKGDGFFSFFPGWIPDDRVVVLDPPTGGTFVLRPMATIPGSELSPMAVRVGTEDGGSTSSSAASASAGTISTRSRTRGR